MYSESLNAQSLSILKEIDTQLHDNAKNLLEYSSRFKEKIDLVRKFLAGWDSGGADATELQKEMQRINKLVAEEFPFNERQVRWDEETLKRIEKLIDLSVAENRQSLDKILTEFTAFSGFIKRLNGILSEQKAFFTKYGKEVGLERRHIIELTRPLKEEELLLSSEGLAGGSEREQLDSVIKQVEEKIDRLNKDEEELRIDPYRINVDLHLHPNLPRIRPLARSKARKIWKRAQELKIDVLVSSEHSFKDAEYAYEVMLETKPPNIHLFPGKEVYCIEMTEVLVFSDAEPLKQEEVPDTAKVYAGKNPFFFEKAFDDASKYHVVDVVQLARRRGYAVYIPHPYLPKEGFIDRMGEGKIKGGEDALKRMLSKHGVGVEVHCNSFGLLNQLLETTGLQDRLEKAQHKKGAPMTLRQRIEFLDDLPQDIRQHATFYGGGGDAHTPLAMETVLSVPTSKKKNTMSRDEVYKLITTNTSPRTTVIPRKRKLTARSVLSFIWTIGTVVAEFIQVETSAYKHRVLVKESINRLKTALLDPESTPEQIEQICIKIPEQILSKVWAKMTEDEKKLAIDLARKRYTR